MNQMTGGATQPGGNLERLMEAAQDSVTDDMVSRLADTASQAMDLVDRLNRSGVADALPALAALVRSGDLERVTHYARMLGAAEDAVTDDMVGRFAALAAEGTTVLDRLNRSGVTKLIDLLDQLNGSGALDRIATKLPALVDNLEMIEKMFGCLGEASREVKNAPAPGGGLMTLLAMMRDPENQKVLQFFFALGRRMREACTAKA
jgi:uncharacterized protein YjgD (DUF1641 family)